MKIALDSRKLNESFIKKRQCQTRRNSSVKHGYQYPTNHGTVYKRVNKLKTDIQFKHSYRETTKNQQTVKLFKINSPSKSKTDKVNGIDLEFIFKKTGPSPETSQLRSERNKILQPNKTKIVGRGRDNDVCKSIVFPKKAKKRSNGSTS